MKNGSIWTSARLSLHLHLSLKARCTEKRPLFNKQNYVNGIISGIIYEFSKVGIFNLCKTYRMKKWGLGLLFAFASAAALAQEKNEKTLLWQVSGNGLEKPSYLFGTIHMICSEDAVLSDSL